jgi:hypothetical protein
MQTPLKFSLVQHASGLWEASARLHGEELHFGYFLERIEAQRTLDSVKARYGGDRGDPDAG